MEYYTYTSIDHNGLENFRGYVFKTNKPKNIAMIHFNDGNYRDYLRKQAFLRM